jgi:hypothetical protein
MKRFREPIVYGKQDIGGITVRPVSHQVMEKAVEGHPIEVSSGNDYINLYHVFERMVASDKKRLGRLQLVRRQIARSKWHLFVVEDEAEVPEVDLDEGYDPKRGRYKRYAEQLAAGNVVVLPSREEAIKSRRAWQLYVPRAERKHLRSTVRKSGNSGKYAVAVLPRE